MGILKRGGGESKMCGRGMGWCRGIEVGEGTAIRGGGKIIRSRGGDPLSGRGIKGTTAVRGVKRWRGGYREVGGDEG